MYIDLNHKESKILMKSDHIYDVDLTWNGDRKGTLSSPAFEQKVEVATPPQFPGGMEGYWSPEHLLVAAVNSCLMTTFLSIAEFSKLNFSGFHSRGTGKLDKVDGKMVVSEITLSPVVEIHNEKDRKKTERILHKAKDACLISNSVTSKIIFELEVVVLEVV